MSNPFEAPTSDLRSDVPPSQRPLPPNLADPWTRLGARMVDQLALVLSAIPGAGLGMALAPLAGDDDIATLLFVVCACVPMMGLVGYQWSLTSTEGTTIGKRATGICIVRDNGLPIDFMTGVVMRTWVINLVVGFVTCFLGGLGNLLGLIDALMIFSEGHRTLHDRIAGTSVIVGRPGEA